MRRAALAISAVVLAVLPASAAAATISLTSPNGLVYQAAPGEVNALALTSMNWPLPFVEYAAPLTVGPGCVPGTPVLCGNPGGPFGTGIHVTLGDRADVATVNSYFGGTTMNAGSGDDDVVAGGFDATASGEAGDDTIRLAADSGTFGFGGPGDDRLTGGSGAYDVELDGGPGRDLLVPNGRPYNYAHGGPGRDSLVSLGGATRLYGENGSDVILAFFGGALDAGRGPDLVIAASGAHTVSAGPGADRIDTVDSGNAAPDSVSCGAGFDVVWADTDDTVSADCERRRSGPAPQFPRAIRAEADARALLLHRPDPSALGNG